MIKWRGNPLLTYSSILLLSHLDISSLIPAWKGGWGILELLKPRFLVLEKWGFLPNGLLVNSLKGELNLTAGK